MPRAIVLVDGEHYPAVTQRALAEIEKRGDEVAAAVLLGGGEKLAGRLDLGAVPVVEGEGMLDALRRAIAAHAADVVVECSDSPVVDVHARALLSAVALAAGLVYRAPGLTLEPPERPRISPVPSIAVIGTGKRTGKTAVSAGLARILAADGLRPVVVAMGRGGPPEPVVIRGDQAPPSVDELISVADAGGHAATDAYEDAATAGVAAVAAWRAGAGPAGAPLADSVAAAVRAAAALAPGAIILEGSGTAIPPVGADATVLVAGAGTPDQEIRSGTGPYRFLIADLVVATMIENPVHSAGTLSALSFTIQELARDVPIVRTVFRPKPLGVVRGRKVFFATTAPEQVGEALRDHLERAHGAQIVGVTHRLADRARLSEDLAQAEGTYEVLLTELKAAAIDVAARAGRAAGAEVVLCDNVPVPVRGDDLDAALRAVVGTARERFPG